MNAICKVALALAFGMIEAQAASEVAVRRERDTADRHAILRWYDWGKKGADGKFVQCEGRLDYDIEIPKSGWYSLEQQGAPCGWDRTIYLDNRPVRTRLKTDEFEFVGKNRDQAWHKEFNLFLEKGKHALAYERTGFPGAFPARWQLTPSDGTVRGTLRVDIKTDVVRTTDEVELTVTCGTDRPLRYELVALGRSNDETNLLAVVETPAVEKPTIRTVRAKAPPQEGVYTVTVREHGVVGWGADASASALVVVDTRPREPGTELKKTLVVDIDCVKTAPYVERDGATKIVKTSFGAYRESSGNASDSHWALDGFSYNYQLPDICHAYLLEVTYPDDKFRSVGFWSNDAGVLGEKADRRGTGNVLTGGVETGGQYRNTMSMLTHEAFFYPLGTNIVLAVVNLNRGSAAAASRIRVYRIDGSLPAAPKGMRRGRLAGGFFEENGRWKRFFGMGHDPSAKRCEDYEDLRTMERWAQWNRFAGVNTMSPSVVAYGGVQYPSKVIDGSSVQTLNEMRMLALVAEKYDQVFIPHITLHGDQSFDKRMGIGSKPVPDAKCKEGFRTVPTFADEAVVEWSKEGKTEIPWRSWCYNCLHPKVQAYLLDVAGEVAEMLGEAKSFGGLSIRIPLSWQFSGITGLNNADYGYGDWTIGEFAKDTGIAVPGAKNDPKRFQMRYRFLMADAMRPTWLKWRNDRIKAYYRRVRARLNPHGENRELYFMWWPSSRRRDEMNECGIDPDYWQNEPGISFYGMQFFYGRRYFAPRALFDQQHNLYDELKLKMSRAGRRAVGIYSDYYEPNDPNFEWKKFGGAPYTAFDALEPAGIYERQNYAVPLSQLDVGVYFNGGNGWIFGTPAKTCEFMREFLALPSERFTPVAGVAQDPVVVRECVTDEGRFVYFVNPLDVAVEVSLELDGRGKIAAAADLREVKPSFTLPPFSLKSLVIGKSSWFGSVPRVINLKTQCVGPAAPARDQQVAFLTRLRDLAVKRQAGVELRKDIYDEAMGAATAAIEGQAAGKYLQVAGALSNPKLVYLYDLVGLYPPGLFEAHPQIIGGYPARAADRPKLTLMRQWGGDPLEGPGRGEKIWSATDGSRTWLSFAAGAHGQLREFDAAGQYVRSGVLTVFADDSYNNGESRHGFLRDPAYWQGGPIVWTNGFLYAQSGGETPKYDVADYFRQGVSGFGERVAMPSRPAPLAVKLKLAADNFIYGSQLKVRDGRLLYHGEGGVWSLDPQTGKRQCELPVKGDFVFDVTPQGKLVTTGVKGDGFGQTDLLANDDGSFLRRTGPWDRLKFEKVSADGTKKPVFDFDYRDFRQGSRFGFCRGADGTIYVAGAGSRRVAAFRPNGELKWSRQWRPAQATALGDLPLRCPASVAVDAKGRLWIADFAADHLIALDAKDGRYLGLWGHSGTMDDRTGFGFSAITGLAVIGDDLYVLDGGNLRLLKFHIFEI